MLNDTPSKKAKSLVKVSLNAGLINGTNPIVPKI